MEGNSSFSAMAPPVFNGDNYTIWAVRMEAYLDAVDLWEAVDDDYDVPPLSDNPTYLKFEYEGDDQIKGMKVLNLIRDFELQKMKESETIKEYSERLLSIANRVRLLGSEFKDSRIVEKIMVTIPERFEATITTLENTRDLSKITLAKLLNSLPQERKVIGVKWVFRTKLNVDGLVNKYKTRLQGLTQSDYFLLFLRNLARKCIRWMLNQHSLMEFFKKKIYVEQPEDDYLLGLDFKKSLSESTLYVKENNNEILVVSLYVDALLITGSSAKLIDEFKLDMMQVFEMTDLGLMTYFLGMEIKQGKDQEILKKFRMEDCKEMNTPMSQKEKLSKDDGDEKVEETYFRSLIGCLMYLTATRLDILYVVSVLSRFMHYASEVHLKAAKRVVRYIKGTVDYGVKFQKIPNMKLFGYFDNDWGGSLDDMKSTSGYCFRYCGSIYCRSGICSSNHDSKSSIVAEEILVDLHMKQTQGTEVFVDNQATITISHNPVFHGKTKHFNIKLFFLRGVQKDGDINLCYCKVEEQLTDIFTKPLSVTKFEYLKLKLGVCSS
uniref:Retrovirus-related Pol polyprotein from transposon RE1 n=1 Tax=Vitis vinifera TaxID=29760 RepID=A5BXS1_VITVI|nr:hypothetical protein VITISV_031322 [Vitis vinifera]